MHRSVSKSWRPEWEIAVTMLTACIPIVLLVCVVGLLFSERQIMGMWVSTIAGDCFLIGTIPAYIAALAAWRKTEIARMFFPKCRAVITGLLVLDAAVVFLNVSVIVRLLTGR